MLLHDGEAVPKPKHGDASIIDLLSHSDETDVSDIDRTRS